MQAMFVSQKYYSGECKAACSNYFMVLFLLLLPTFNFSFAAQAI